MLLMRVFQWLFGVSGGGGAGTEAQLRIRVRMELRIRYLWCVAAL